ncbi:hypothetical protein CIB48_g5150 [Xylaria polymorpha]|nr:hypothetical protein CIB48_g5150 [Xylaria polymorpha]
MRFRASLRNTRTFSSTPCSSKPAPTTSDATRGSTELVAALSSLEKIAWVRLDDETVRFTVIPDTGSQVWASLSIDFILDNWTIQSAEPNNTINLELPLVPLQRALKSATNAVSASLRLTKKMAVFAAEPLETNLQREREKVITQDIPVRVLHPGTVETIMQPKVREPDVHIQLPPLLQLKAISDRFTKLAVAARASSSSASAANVNPKLELSANMHGDLRLRLDTDTLDVESRWNGLENPQLDPSQLTCAIEDHPSTRFRNEGPDKWATVRVDGKDWSKVLSVGRLDGRVIACFADDHALILYVYVPHHDDPQADDSVVTLVKSPF